MSFDDLHGVVALDEHPIVCSWCGKQVATGLGADDCLCGYCKKCHFIHDGGPCRTGVVLFHARWSADGCVHTIQWTNRGNTIVIPTCFDYPPHSKHWPDGLGFSQVDAPVDCMRCLAERGNTRSSAT